MIRRAFSLLLRLPRPSLVAAGLLLLAAVAGHVPTAGAEELMAKAEAAQAEAAAKEAAASATQAEGVATQAEVPTQAEAGRGALRPYVHVLAAYGIAWVLVCAWTWWIAKGLKRVEEELGRGAGTRG